MTPHATTDALAALDAHYAAMPPVAAMQVRTRDYDGARLRLTAPLAANVNDKGCAFGGSLAGLMTLAAWGLVTLKLGEAGRRAEVYVADSQIRYLAPLYDTLVAEARLAEAETWEGFLATYAERGRARAIVHARVALPNGGDAATLVARFAALGPGA